MKTNFLKLAVETLQLEANAIMEMSKRLPLVMEHDTLHGIITDGDLRRAFDRFDNINQIKAKDIMSLSPKYVSADARFAEAEAYMHAEKIDSLVVKESNKVIGVLNIYDIDHY